MKRSIKLLPEGWPDAIKNMSTENGRKHSGTIKTGAIVYHTMVPSYLYGIYVFNASKGIFEYLGEYMFIREDSLSYLFKEVKSELSNIEVHEITILKMLDDRVFFQALHYSEIGGEDSG